MKFKVIAFWLFLILGFWVRLYQIKSPLADWHSWRQVDTASVARYFFKHGYHWLNPKFDDISSSASGLENPEGYRFVEFPIFNAAHAFLFQIIEKLKPGELTFETVGRLTAVISSLGGAVFLYLIVNCLLGSNMALLSMAFFLFLPFNIYYSRTVMPEPMMICLTLASIYFLLKSSLFKKKTLAFLSLVLAMGAILIKPYAVFILIPSWLVVFKKEIRGKKLISIIIYSLLSFLPFLLWRFWSQKFPEGLPATGWLFNKEGIRLRPAWWRWLFGERLAKLILGSWGLIPLVFGLISKGKKEKEMIFYSWLFGLFGYLAVFAGGNVAHDYYQVIAVPALSFFLAKGTLFLIKAPARYFNRFFSLAIVFGACFFSLGLSWYQIKEYYKINRPEIIEVGEIADKILPPEAKVVAPHGGDTALLYYINRRGWPIVTLSLKENIRLGASHYVAITSDPMTNDLIEKCSPLEKSDLWVIIDLSKCRERE